MDAQRDNKFAFDKEQREKLTTQFADVPVAVKFVVKGVHGDEATEELSDFVRAYAKLAPGFSVKVENTPTEQNAPVVELWVDGDPSGVSFCGVPSGKELESFTKAVLNAGGKGDNIPDEVLR